MCTASLESRHITALQTIPNFAQVDLHLQALSRFVYSHPPSETCCHNELFAVESQKRAGHLLPLIRAMYALSDRRGVLDETGVIITSTRVVEAVGNWQAIVRCAMRQSSDASDALHADEWGLYTQLGYEARTLPGLACREINRKATAEHLGHNLWGTYGWEWVRTMSARATIINTHRDTGIHIRPCLNPPCHFVPSLASLSSELISAIVAHLSGVADLVSLRHTNKFFHELIPLPCYTDLQNYRTNNLRDPSSWLICSGCSRLLHTKHFDRLRTSTGHHLDNIICLQCGTRPLSAAIAIHERRTVVNKEGYYVDPTHLRCQVYFGGGYRWMDMDGLTWLRCAKCHLDDIDHGLSRNVCTECDLAADGTECLSCRLYLPISSFDRWSDFEYAAQVCVPCGSQDLPPGIDRNTGAAIYLVTSVEASRWGLLPGMRFGTNHIWKDREYQSWKRCKSCTKASKVQALSYGNCPTCLISLPDKRAISPTLQEEYRHWRWCVACVHCGKAGRVRTGVTLTHCDRYDCLMAKVQGLNLAVGGLG